MGYTTPHVVKHMAYGFSAIENSEQLIHCLFSSLLCMKPIHFGAARYYNIVLTPYLPFPYTLSESMDSRPYPLYPGLIVPRFGFSTPTKGVIVQTCTLRNVGVIWFIFHAFQQQ